MSARTMTSPVGTLRIVAANGQVRAVEFLDEGVDDDGTEERGDAPVLVEAERQLRAYFDGALREFDLPLAPEGTAFQQRVWHELRAIPFGTTTTYQKIADALHTSARPVGGANGANPIAIVVPCHRVVGATGLTGYGGGLWRKEWLLAHEGARTVMDRNRQGALFR